MAYVLRSEPDVNSVQRGKLDRDTPLIILGESENGWYKVKVNALLSGWVPTSRVELDQPDRPIALVTSTPTKPPKTATPTPSPTLAATNTPQVTNTPAATNTTVPPTPEPEPFVYSGIGDDVVTLPNPGELGVLYVEGNAASAHFAVTSYDRAGEYMNLLVNTTDPYKGFRPLDFMDDEATATLEIKATGPWTVQVISPYHSSLLDHWVLLPEQYQGIGDDVLFIIGSPTKATISGNGAGAHFAVIGYNGGWNLLVNTTDPYEGKVRLHPGTVALEIKATGSWSINIE